MFQRIPPGPQPAWKRPLYLGLTTLLGVMVSYVLHAVVEVWYLSAAETRGWDVRWTKHLGLGLCALPVAAQYGLLATGLIGGFLMGRVWWRWVYVERRWGRRV